MSFPRGGPGGSSSVPWSWEENKRFENFLVSIPDGPDRWSVMAKELPGRTPQELKLRYEKLVADIADIEEDRVALPWPLSEEAVGSEESEQADQETMREADQETKRRTSAEEGRWSGTVSVRRDGSCGSSSIPWLCEENKMFSALHPDDRQDRWSVAAKCFPDRPPLKLKLRYEELPVEISDTVEGCVPPPLPEEVEWEETERADQEAKKETSPDEDRRSGAEG
ncbi:unnamed protein product [Victoria cruziana]